VVQVKWVEEPDSMYGHVCFFTQPIHSFRTLQGSATWKVLPTVGILVLIAGCFLSSTKTYEVGVYCIDILY